MTPFQLPRNPDDFLKPSLVDEQGNNPFAEDAIDVPSEEADSDNLYSSPQQSDEPVYRPHGFQSALPHRGWFIFILSLVGLVGAAASVLAAFLYYPMAIANLALTIPPCVMGYYDLRAIKAGAVDPSGKRLTKSGFVIGVIGTAISLITGSLLVALIFLGE